MYNHYTAFYDQHSTDDRVSTGFVDDNVPDSDRIPVHVFVRVQSDSAHWPRRTLQVADWL